MGFLRVKVAAAVVLALAGCNQDDSDNVMAAQVNALTPAQVNLALGPEVTGTPGNQLNPSNGMNAVNPANAVVAADTEDALDESLADEPSTANNSSEE